MLRDAAPQVAKKPLCYRQRPSHMQGEEGEDRKYRSWMRKSKIKDQSICKFKRATAAGIMTR